jgi:hypothetical protein
MPDGLASGRMKPVAAEEPATGALIELETGPRSERVIDGACMNDGLRDLERRPRP